MTKALEKRNTAKDEILEAALLHASFDGWCRRTLVNAATDAGYDKATAMRLFPRGGDSLLAWLDDWLDRQMLDALDPEVLERLPIRQRIARLVRARLEAVSDHKEAMRRAAVAHGLPGNAFEGLQSLWRTADRMWEKAGFGEAAGEGLTWYTRRAMLVGVFGSTFLFWLDDRSENHKATWSFLDRRIEDVMMIGRWRGRLTGAFHGLRRFQPGGRRGTRAA